MGREKKAREREERLKEIEGIIADYDRAERLRIIQSQRVPLSHKLQALLGTLISILAALAAINWVTVSRWYTAVIAPFLSSAWMNLLAIPIAGGLGWGLVTLKRRAKLLYGALEVAFALTVATWQGVNRLVAGGWAEAATALGALYFVVRGLDNILAALDEQKAAKTGSVSMDALTVDDIQRMLNPRVQVANQEATDRRYS